MSEVSRLQATTVTSTARPPGSHCGHRCELSPAAKSSVVRARGVPPPSDTRKTPDESLGAKAISPDGLQLAPQPVGASARTAGVPPAIGVFLSFPSAKKPDPLSVGREERETCALGAGQRPRRQVGHRARVEPRAAAVGGHVDELLPVWRHGDRAFVVAGNVERHERRGIRELDGEVAGGRCWTGRRPEQSRGRDDQRGAGEGGPEPPGHAGADGRGRLTRRHWRLGVVEFEPRVADRAQPLARVLLEAAAQQPADGGGRAGG